MESTSKKIMKQVVSSVVKAGVGLLVVEGVKKFCNRVEQVNSFRDSTGKNVEKQKEEIAKRLGRPPIDTNSYEDAFIGDVVNPVNIDVVFESIGGLESIKQELDELVILPLKRPELFAGGKLLGPQKGVLLYGPPGTGKTMIAKALAKESGAVFINVKISKLMSKWLGDGQKHVAAVFSLANKLQPAIIFIDEVDGFLGKRGSNDHETITSMKTEFMSSWDGFATDKDARVMVLAATNRPSELDEAILRRFPRSFEIGLPNQKERAAILKITLKGENADSNINWDYLAGLCEGYSGSDLTNACKTAAYIPVRELLKAEKDGKQNQVCRALAQGDLEKVLRNPNRTTTSAHEYSSQASTSN